jgi:phosphotransacetylase
MSLDVAISPEAAATKALAGPIAGDADVLIVPSVEAGNAMAKGILYFARGLMAGLVVGARVPVIINSRADNHDTRVRSIAMAVVLSAALRRASDRLGLRFEDSVRPEGQPNAGR